MLNLILGAVVSVVAGVIGVVIIQNVLDGQTTTSWSAATITLVFLLPMILAAVVIMGVLKLLGRG